MLQGMDCVETSRLDVLGILSGSDLSRRSRHSSFVELVVTLLRGKKNEPMAVPTGMPIPGEAPVEERPISAGQPR